MILGINSKESIYSHSLNDTLGINSKESIYSQSKVGINSKYLLGIIPANENTALLYLSHPSKYPSSPLRKFKLIEHPFVIEIFFLAPAGSYNTKNVILYRAPTARPEKK